MLVELLLVTALAADGQSIIREYAQCSGAKIIIVNTFSKLGEDDKAKPEFDAAMKCLNDGLPGAIKAAGNNSDLKGAVKEFQVKATSAAGAALSGKYDTGSAEQSFIEAFNRLKMEAVAAGKW